MSSSQKIEINEQTCVELLKKYIDTGFKESNGVVSIREGAILHRYFRILKKQVPESFLEDATSTSTRLNNNSLFFISP